MKKSFYSLLIAALFSIGSLCAHGAEATAQAIVLKVKGTANAISAGQTQPAVLKVGDKLPQGATIVTGADSEVDIQAFNGAVATITSGTTVNLEKLSVTTSGGVVTKQTALLNLKVGSILSAIDPANHNINDYSIRTPKGVAAARGTGYGVTVSGNGSVQIFVTQSQVTFTSQSTGATVVVPTGAALMVLPNGGIMAISADQVAAIQAKLKAGDKAGADEIVGKIAIFAHLSTDDARNFAALMSDGAVIYNHSLTAETLNRFGLGSRAPGIPDINITVIPESPSN